MLFDEKINDCKPTSLELSECSNQITFRLSQDSHYIRGPHALADTTIDLENNLDGLDWTRIAERVCKAFITSPISILKYFILVKVSDASSVKRTAIDCRVGWIGDRHPRINHGEWAAPEIAKLSELVSKEKSTVDWVEVAKQLGVCWIHYTSYIRTN
jgi:hypothetical protein